MVGRATDYYVYLLRDPRDDEDGRGAIFYIGKGHSGRALDHAAEAAAVLKDLADAEESEEVRRELGKKLALLMDLKRAGVAPLIDVLAGEGARGLSETVALAAEAALIAVLRMTELGNKVLGHELRLMPESVFTRANRAEQRELPKDGRFVAVPVSNIWGGADYAGTLFSASDDEVWENARQLWSPISAIKRENIRTYASSERPAALLALASHPGRGRSAIVVGVYELIDARPTADMKGGFTRKDGTWLPEYPGWEFLRADVTSESETTRELRNYLLGHIPTREGVPLNKPQDRSYPLGL